MKGLNKVQLIGNLGTDPETRYTPEGKQVTRFRMAVNRVFKNNKGESIEDTQWFNVEAWSGLAKVVEEYLQSGDRVYIEGRLRTKEYEKDGETKYFTKVVVQEMIMLGGSKRGDENPEDDEPPF
ncbi:MAG: single-stranded DNA-binding protein [Anaerolineales bacterium]|nr:single-stranded DNA-binding protein [Anaerolineales bacterium]